MSLQVNRILDIAELSRADGIHPGYGFLSENEGFARVRRHCHVVMFIAFSHALRRWCQAVEQRGKIFIGPPADAILAMGSKVLVFFFEA